MITEKKSIRIWVWLFSAFLVFACFDGSAPAVTEPQTSHPSPTPILIPLEPTLTPFPPPLSDSSFTLTPTIIPSPTNTPLPPLPDFGQILAFGVGGGGGSACMAPRYPPPTVHAARSSKGTHVAGICVYDIALPLNTPIHVILTSPDGTIILQGDFQSSGAPWAYWLDKDGKSYEGYAENCDDTSCRNWGMEFWWPADLPGNTWQLRLSWNGGEAVGIFDTSLEATLPELSAQDAFVGRTIRPSASTSPCHPVASAAGLAVAGRGFPANAVVYVPVFEQVEGTQYRFLNAQIFVADGNGVIYGALNGPFQSGKKYALAGVTDATLPLIAPDKGGVVSFVNLEDAADCFIVP